MSEIVHYDPAPRLDAPELHRRLGRFAVKALAMLKTNRRHTSGGGYRTIGGGYSRMADVGTSVQYDEQVKVCPACGDDATRLWCRQCEEALQRYGADRKQPEMWRPPQRSVADGSSAFSTGTRLSVLGRRIGRPPKSEQKAKPPEPAIAGGPRLSKNGKRLGRPPKVRTATPALEFLAEASLSA